MLQLVVSGLALGSIYALIGLSLVLIHKATDVVNFAQGEMAMFSTFLSFALLSKVGLPLAAVVLLSFPIGALLGAIVERVFIQPISRDPPVNILIVTIGLWIIFNNLAGWIWGYDPYRFPSLFPERPIEIAGARISPNSLGIIAVALLLMAALYLFFEHTREGTAMRAASMNRRAARLMGIRVSRVWLLSWAHAGAILGGFNSLPGAVVGGFAVGLLEVLFGSLVSSTFKDNFAFVIIILVLMLRPNGIFGRVYVKKV
jgi:branched-chain amino acid transport system permease protein